MPVKAGVIRAGARNTRRGAAETFTGVVFQDPVITAEAPSRLGGRSLRSRREHAPRGTPTRLGRRSSVCPASAASASRARSRKC